MEKSQDESNSTLSIRNRVDGLTEIKKQIMEDDDRFDRAQDLVKELREDLRLWGNDAAIDRVQVALSRICDVIDGGHEE